MVMLALSGFLLRRLVACVLGVVMGLKAELVLGWAGWNGWSGENAEALLWPLYGGKDKGVLIS
jgi:hypothetical protein